MPLAHTASIDTIRDRIEELLERRLRGFTPAEEAEYAELIRLEKAALPNCGVADPGWERREAAEPATARALSAT